MDSLQISYILESIELGKKTKKQKTMEHIKTFESFKSDVREISEAAGSGTVIADKLVKQHFGKTIK